MTEKYVSVIQDTSEGNKTKVKCAVELTKWFNVKVGLHEESALSPIHFATVINRSTNEIREETPQVMTLADDIAFC